MGIAAAGIAPGTGHGQLRNARSLDYTQLERSEENALDIAEFYWHFDAEAPLEQLDNYAGEFKSEHNNKFIVFQF